MRAAGLVFAAAVVACTPSRSPPTIASCSALPAFENHRAPDAVILPLHLENRLGRAFEVTGVCISIDGHAIRQDAPAAVTTGFAGHAPLDLRALLRPGRTHDVVIVVTLAGRGTLEGYAFSVASAHAVGPAELQPDTLIAELVERGAPDTPAEQHPTVEWRGPGSAPTP